LQDQAVFVVAFVLAVRSGRELIGEVREMDSKLIMGLVAAGLAVILVVVIVAIQPDNEDNGDNDITVTNNDLTGTMVGGGDSNETTGTPEVEGSGEEPVTGGSDEGSGGITLPSLQQQAINVVVTDYPSKIEPGSLYAVYHDGVAKRGFYDNETPGQMTLQSPNRLGGELAVYFRKSEEAIRLWAYIWKVTSRQISLPADADLIVTDTDLVDCQLSFAKEDTALLVNWHGVGFFAAADTKLPLFFATMNVGDSSVTDYNNVTFKAVPGKYHTRAIVSKDGHERQVGLGTMEITGEKLKKYEIDVPYK
jgi:hypothetical protein